ncbi:MAG: hypothetical protein ABIM89_04010 [Mycobacteriales bacterium]
MTERRRDPPPLRTNDMRTVAVGTALWLGVLLGLVLRHDSVERAGLLWWYAMCACGIALGLLGVVYLKVRPAQLERKQRRRDEERSLLP